MDVRSSILCVGCLCVGRKMLILEDYWKKKCFQQIFNEIPLAPGEIAPFSVCWECEAVIARFTRFKRQVVESFKVFQNYLKQNLDITEVKPASKLKTQNIVEIAISPNRTTSEALDVEIKTEKESNFDGTIEVKVKSEDNGSFFSDGDEEALVEVARRKKKSRKVSNGNLTEKNLNDTAETPEEELCETELEEDRRISIKTEYNSSVSTDGDDNDAVIEVPKKKKKHKVTKRGRKKSHKESAEFYKEVELTDKELKEERRVLAAKDDYVNAMYKCENCILAFPNADDLKDHFSLKHELNASNFKCEVCCCTFAREISYNYHIKKHRRRFRCIVCRNNFNSKLGASKHYNFVHSQSIDHSYDVNVTLDVKTDAQDETQMTASGEEPASFPCELCDKSFRWKTSLRKHLELHRIETGQKRKPYCETCSLSFTTTSNLQKHVKTSSKHKIQLKLRKLRESAEDEGSAEKQHSIIEQIIHSVNKEREMFPCPQCDKKFQWRGNLARHLHSHAARAKGDLVCTPCNRTFSSKATYEQHMRISMKHVSENDFKYMCSECGKRFSNKTRLRDHVMWDHLKNFIYKCAQCQKVFKSNTSLYLHKQNVHQKDQAGHLCQHCGKSFPNQAKLRAHVAGMHGREGPYRCSACGARFSWHSCLSRHVRRCTASGTTNVTHPLTPH
ncbi:zinc finger protein 57-like [Battus philenor]|uniref:zinc finger protein 57-like n=1 Tax=Battus philenor TaxID=42288 RepID=UPI0035D00BFF